MSVIVILPIVLPAVWPAIAAAAVAATGAMGFAAVQGKVENRVGSKVANSVDLKLENAEDVTGSLAHGQQLVFTRDDIQVVFSRDTRGKLSLQVHGHRSKVELEALGKELLERVTQQYAYNRIMTELKERNFNVVGEETEEDGTVRLQVRVFRQ